MEREMGDLFYLQSVKREEGEKKKKKYAAQWSVPFFFFQCTIHTRMSLQNFTHPTSLYPGGDFRIWKKGERKIEGGCRRGD